MNGKGLPPNQSAPTQGWKGKFWGGLTGFLGTVVTASLVSTSLSVYWTNDYQSRRDQYQRRIADIAELKGSAYFFAQAIQIWAMEDVGKKGNGTLANQSGHKGSLRKHWANELEHFTDRASQELRSLGEARRAFYVSIEKIRVDFEPSSDLDKLTRILLLSNAPVIPFPPTTYGPDEIQAWSNQMLVNVGNSTEQSLIEPLEKLITFLESNIGKRP